MKGEIVLVDQIFVDYEIFEFGVSPLDFALSIYVNDNHTLESQLKNKRLFNWCMKEYMNTLKENDINITEYEMKGYNYVSKNFDNILESVEYIRLNFEKTNELEYIKNNPILLTKKIVLKEYIDITDFNKLKEIMNKYKDYINNIYIASEGNENYVSLNDCYKTMLAIRKKAKEIEELKLSPMETIMYTYDIVRNRVYTKEDEGETSFKSRDLSEVLFGDKIVCVGYSKIFSSILNSIGIRNNLVSLKEKGEDAGHERNIVYVKDKKYNIDGVYYFDATWDSKEEEGSNDYLNSYIFFAKTKKYMDEEEGHIYLDNYFPIYDIDMDKEIVKALEDNDLDKLEYYRKSINYISNMVNNTPLLTPLETLKSPLIKPIDKEYVINKFIYAFNKFNKEIPAETMIKLLNNVRKIEYYQNPEWYPYTLNDIYRISIISDWKFTLRDDEKLVKAIFGMDEQEYNKKYFKEKFLEYAKKDELFKNIIGTKLAKTLRLTLEKKNK